ncbi:MAG: hypothetical protein ACRD3J_04245 [Thermoanaerobaculia bacterium]
MPLSEKALDEMVARERERGAPSLTDWASLSARLRTEGLMQPASASSRFISRGWMQAAAGLVLVAGGAAVGRMTAGSSAVPAVSQQTASAVTSPPGVVPVSAQDPSAATPTATLASEGAPFTSPEQAWDVLNTSGAEYQRASAYLSSTGSATPMATEPSQYRTRLAALDNVMNDMRGALKDAPHDPVINQYYRAAVGVREATLRQLGTTLPAGAKLNRY